jgi:hypothetical protein
MFQKGRDYIVIHSGFLIQWESGSKVELPIETAFRCTADKPKREFQTLTGNHTFSIRNTTRVALRKCQRINIKN